MKQILTSAILVLCVSMNTQAQYWQTNGNAGTPGNFLGTTNSWPLFLKVNNFNSGRIESDGSTINAYANTGYGYRSLASLGGGSNNTASGAYSLFSNITGMYNVATGFYALGTNGGGGFNTAVGTYCMYQNTSGGNNTAIGEASMPNNTTGGNNVAVGKAALLDNISGLYNTGIGYFTYPSYNSYNWTGIGSTVGGSYSVDNSVEIGNTSVSRIWGQVAMTTFSDRRIKENIKENVPGLDFINKLRPVTYNLNIHTQNAMLYKNKEMPQQDWDSKYDIEKMSMSGFIAQEVEKAAQEAGYDFSGIDKPSTADGIYGLRYSEFVMPLVKSVQELSAKNKTLQQQNEELKAQYNELKNIVTEMQQSLSQCCSNYQNPKTSAILDITNQNPVLEQNFPNPSNGSSVIRCNVPGAFNNAVIKVFSMEGATLMTFPVQQGSNSFTISGDALAIGIYNYSLIIDGKVTDSKKMVIIK